MIDERMFILHRGWHARVMEIFRGLGLEEKVIAAGGENPRTAGFLAGKSLTSVIGMHPPLFLFF